jgi:hypothetical protein
MWQALYMAEDTISLRGRHFVHPGDSLLRVEPPWSDGW